MNGNGNGLTAEKMIAAIRESRGFISSACNILECSRDHFYVKMKGFPTVQAALEEEREKRHDYVESRMMSRIAEGDTTMIIFYLKTQAHMRGYRERVEISGPNSGPIPITQVDYRAGITEIAE